ncbi:MAG: hypothetical protein WCP35_05080 [Verrucomicrobiota bacterium]
MAIRILPSAVADLDDGREFYEARETGLGDCFQDCLFSDIAIGVGISMTAETGGVGLSYKALGILRGTSPLFADLCRQCGTVIRFHVKEADKPWIEHK